MNDVVTICEECNCTYCEDKKCHNDQCRFCYEESIYIKPVLNCESLIDWVTKMRGR